MRDNALESYARTSRLGIEEQSQLRVLYVHFLRRVSSPSSVWLSFLAHLCLHSVTAQSTDIPLSPRPATSSYLNVVEYWIDLGSHDGTSKYYIRKSLLYKVSRYKCLDLSPHLCEPFLGLSPTFVLCYNLVNWRIAFHLIALCYPSSLLAVNFLNRRGMTDRSAELKANWYR